MYLESVATYISEFYIKIYDGPFKINLFNSGKENFKTK
jgi:hypothetical protein